MAAAAAHVRFAGTGDVSQESGHVVAEKNRLAKGAYGANVDFSHEVDETLKLGEKFADTFVTRRYW